MQRFHKLFDVKKGCQVFGMIHVEALPGTPKYSGNFQQTIEKAISEAKIYKKHNLDGILIENMHDVPYIQNKNLGPEITACMTRVATEIRKIIPADTPCGLQILACGNKQAISIAKASDCQFIRSEGFVFSHVADEGFTDACAGELMRYRRDIDAEDVLVFCDIKKKHSSHSISADVSLLETAKAAEFFLSDGIVITGSSTGCPTSPDDLNEVYQKIMGPILIGSGVTEANLGNYFEKADAVIVGSHFKKGGDWSCKLSEDRVTGFMKKVNKLRNM